MLPDAELDSPMEAEPISCGRSGQYRCQNLLKIFRPPQFWIFRSSMEFRLVGRVSRSLERDAIRCALARTRYNRTAAAQLLGITFRQLRYRMQRSVSSDVADVWLEGVYRVDSPNFVSAAARLRARLIIVHSISLRPVATVVAIYRDCSTNTLEVSADPYFAQVAGLNVSAHVLTERDGRVTQYVSFADRAWHAGVSRFDGRTACNDFSVGIELEGTDFEAFADAQYAALNSVIAALLAAYPIEAVRGHADVAPDRKTDPGPFFDWCRVELPSSVSTPPA